MNDALLSRLKAYVAYIKASKRLVPEDSKVLEGPLTKLVSLDHKTDWIRIQICLGEHNCREILTVPHITKINIFVLKFCPIKF